MLCFAGLFLVGLDVFVWFVLGFVCSDLSSGGLLSVVFVGD